MAPRRKKFEFSCFLRHEYSLRRVRGFFAIAAHCQQGLATFDSTNKNTWSLLYSDKKKIAFVFFAHLSAPVYPLNTD
jgi:hypothetical protein